jgi:hypothetical protein
MHPSFLLFPLLAALPQAPEARPPAPPRAVSPILLALDLNGDGRLTLDEYQPKRPMNAAPRSDKP